MQTDVTSGELDEAQEIRERKEDRPLRIVTAMSTSQPQLTFNRLCPYKPRTSGKLGFPRGQARAGLSRSLRNANPRRAAHRGIK